MLATILALAVGIGSLAIYLIAFFFPEIHRKNDFIWSGVGLFYALILWVFAHRITGGLLLGHMASVALLGWSVTQTLQLRRQLTPKAQQTTVPSSETVKTTVTSDTAKVSLPQQVGQAFKGVGGIFASLKNKVQSVGKKPPKTEAPKPGESVASVVDAISAITDTIKTKPEATKIKEATVVTTPPEVSAVEAIKAVKTAIVAEPSAPITEVSTPVPTTEGVNAVDIINSVKASIVTEPSAPTVEVSTQVPTTEGVSAVDTINGIKASIVIEPEAKLEEGVKAVDVIAAIKASIVTENEEQPKPSEQPTKLMTNQPTNLQAELASDPMLSDIPGA